MKPKKKSSNKWATFLWKNKQYKYVMKAISTEGNLDGVQMEGRMRGKALRWWIWRRTL